MGKHVQVRKPAPPRAKRELPVADAITAALKLRGLSDEIRAGRLVTEWTTLVGPRIAARTRADGIVERTLTIEVATSAWLHELNLIRPQLTRDLTQRLGLPRLFDDLRFRLAGRTRDLSGRTPTVVRPPTPPNWRPPPSAPSILEHQQILADAARIDDPDLRDLITRLRIVNNR